MDRASNPSLRYQIFSPSPIRGEGRGEGFKPVGTASSVNRSTAMGKVTIGLGYVRTASSAAGTALRLAWDGGAVEVVVVELPFTPRP